MGGWAIAYNNPMAIIQARPDSWVGLVTSDNGKLKFNVMSNGVRAGIINLHNAYFKRGNNTLRGIFKVYAPSGDGANDPLNYANFVASQLNVGIDVPLNFETVIIPLSKAIIKMETGTTIAENSYLVGLYSAMDYLGYAVDGGTYTTVTVTGKKKGKSNWWLWLLVAAAGYTIYKKRK